MNEIAFVGDIHGERQQLEQVMTFVLRRTTRIVFLGDYVNRGPDSRGVIDSLIRLRDDTRLSVTFLEGNHDRTFRQALIDNDLSGFLRTGGASAVRSYIGAVPEPNVADQLLAAVPEAHVAFLESLQPQIVIDGVHAAHHPPKMGVPLPDDAVYGVYGHVPQVGAHPKVGSKAAFIDTGCGTLPEGRLTALYWPTLSWVQSSPTTASALR